MENKLVRKSNFLIEAAYRLSAIEQKIVLVLAAMIKSQDREFKTYTLKVRNFSNFIELDSNADYEYLKSVTKTLLEKVFVVRTPNSEIQTHWLSSVEYNHGKGSVVFSFDPKLKPFLLQLKERYTTYRLHDVVQLRSAFSIRMYELLKEYEKIGHRTFEVADLKEILGLTPQQYTLYGDFKRRVILPAQKELKAKTDIAFTFEEIKTGRAVAQIRFRILLNPDYKGQTAVGLPKELTEGTELDQVLEILPEAYQKSQAIKRLLVSYLEKTDVEYVIRNIEYANAKSNAVNAGAAPGKGSNYRNYLAKALQADYGLPFKEDLEALNASQEKARAREKEIKRIQKQEAEQKEREQDDLKRVKVYQENLSAKALQALREEAFEKLPEDQKNMVLQKTPGSGMLLKLAMKNICLDRMHITQPELFSTQTGQEEEE